jgi:hypothetical protein
MNLEESNDVAATAEASPAADEPTGSPEVNWSEIADGLEEDDSSDNGVLAVEGDAEVLGESETPTAPAATPAPTATPTTAEVPPPPTAQSPTPAQEPTPPAPSAPEQPAQPVVDYNEWRKTQLESLEKVYKLDEETSNQLLTEPEVALPKLLANVHLAVLETAMKSVTSVLPSMLTELQTSSSREQQAEELFYSQNQDLRDAKYKSAILEFGQMFRKVNRDAPAEEAARVIGNMVRTAFGLAAPVQASAPPVATPPVAAKPAPYAPVRGGGSAATPPAAQNVWASLAQEFESEY